MARSALTGTRIRERRMARGMRQADLARILGVSAAYLNLIEHNRRRVGPALLSRIAQVLEISDVLLSEDSEGVLISTLREAAVAVEGEVAPELGRVEEFAGRFPGWATCLAGRQQRVGYLERQIEMLSERLAHDPFLSGALHEVLTAVTSVRSSAAILMEGGPISPEWQARFHRNIHDDSLRLSQSAAALVDYLDRADTGAAMPGEPQDVLETWLTATGWDLPGLDPDLPPDTAAALLIAGSDLDGAARDLALAHAIQTARAQAQIPTGLLVDVIADEGLDPLRLAARLGCSPALMARRMASLPETTGLPPIGFAVCDGAGTLILRKPLSGFALPRHGGACPLWPLYEALSHPGLPIRRRVAMQGREARVFMAHAHCETRYPMGSDGPQIAQAYMLFYPDDDGGVAAGATLRIGPSCRICPRRDCPARREQSVVAEAGQGAR